MTHPLAEKFLKCTQFLAFIAFLNAFTTLVIPELVYFSSLLSFFAVTLTCPMLDKGEYLTKGLYHNAEGGTWPPLLSVFALVIAFIALADVHPAASLLLFLLFIPVFIYSTYKYTQIFKPHWEEYKNKAYS